MLLLLGCFLGRAGGFAGDHEVVVDGEDAGDEIGLHAGDGGIAVAVDGSHEGDVGRVGLQSGSRCGHTLAREAVYAPDHSHDLEPLDCGCRCPHGLKAEGGSYHPFERPMVGLDDVVQVLRGSMSRVFR